METTTDGAGAEQPIISYKGFNHDLTCRGFKYEVGKTYKHKGPVAICHRGFHACASPLDVLKYYPIVDEDGRLIRTAVVEQGGKRVLDGGDTKIASAIITIKFELSFGDYVKRCIDWLLGRTRLDVSAASNPGSSGNDAQIGSSGNDARIGSSGNDARIGSSGYGAQIGSSGNDAQIGSSGNGAQIGSSGNGAQIGSSGNGAQIGSSGYGAQIGSSGNDAQIGSSGNDARIGSSGYGARIGVEGKDNVVASAGVRTLARGPDGTWIALAEYDSGGKCIGFATGCIGCGGLEAGTWYRAKGGRLVRV